MKEKKDHVIRLRFPELSLPGFELDEVYVNKLSLSGNAVEWDFSADTTQEHEGTNGVEQVPVASRGYYLRRNIQGVNMDYHIQNEKYFVALIGPVEMPLFWLESEKDAAETFTKIKNWFSGVDDNPK